VLALHKLNMFLFADVIEISDDDERTQSESNVGNCNSSHKNLEYSFIL